MVVISQIILGDVWSDYAAKFAKEHRPFVRTNEPQQQWIDAVNLTFAEQMKQDRKHLFKSIPLKFYNSRLYKQLNQKIKTDGKN